MIHFLWSIFFLLLTMALVLAYVVGFVTILFMVHYIAAGNWREMAEDGRVTSDRVIYIGGKFLLYLLVAAGIAFGVDYLDYRLANYGVIGYQHSAVAAAARRDLLIFFALFILFLIINTVRIHRNAAVIDDGFGRYFQTRLFRNIILSSLVIMMTVYLLQLQKWTGKDNANLEAKQYWVAGQVLNGFRLGLTTFIHPEIPIMIPANRLQQWIYKKGSRYLPENDGEIGVWQNSWFHYHYSRRGRDPIFLNKNGKPSDLMINMLDRQWFCLKTMATKPFADHQMEVEHYYRDYISLALSYSFNEGFYSGYLAGSNSRMAQMPEQVQRSRQLSQWLWELHNKWQKSEEMRVFLEQHPKLEAMYQFEQTYELADIIQGEIYSREFNCNNQSIARYITTRKEFVEGAHGGKPAYLRMKSPSERERIYNLVISNTGARSIKYVIKHYCGFEVAGKADVSRYASWAKVHKVTPEIEAENSAKANFDDEIKILEEMYNGK